MTGCYGRIDKRLQLGVFAAISVIGATCIQATLAMAQNEAPRSRGLAGEIFGNPVSLDNYLFAKRVVYMYGPPYGGSGGSEAEKEQLVWEQLILSFEAHRRAINPSQTQVHEMIQQVVKSYGQGFDHLTDKEGYQQWVQESLQMDVGTFENQIHYILQLQQLKDAVREEQQVKVTEEELRQEFSNERNHVGGEMVVFETKAEAQAFYEEHNTKRRWTKMKKKGKHNVRPVSTMTLEAYMDLWSIPKDQMYAFHAMDLGSVGEPMPFGKQWCVYRLLDKREADFEEFPKRREAYVHQVTAKKKYEAMNAWIATIKEAANLKVYDIEAAIQQRSAQQTRQ